MITIETVWRRISEHAGECFLLEDGTILGYSVTGNRLRHNRTSIPLSQAVFARALAYVPLESSRHLHQVVTGSVYVYAILMDPRIRQNDW